MSSNFNSQNKQSLKTKKKKKKPKHHQKKTLNITLKPENQGQSLRLTNIKQHMIAFKFPATLSVKWGIRKACASQECHSEAHTGGYA